jgi:hypothetical protein
MEDANKMLSQEEIDAVVGKTARPAPAHKTIPGAGIATATSTMTKTAPLNNVQKVSLAPAEASAEQLARTSGGHHHDECIAAGDINSLHERVGEIMNRLSRLELMVTKIENEVSKPGGQANPAALKAAIQQVQNVSSQVEVISEGLRGTAGYNISKVFSCSSCGSVGVVAIKVKCTKCGQENWWGWWPKKK